MMDTLFLDIETIPGQAPWIREWVKDNIKAPGNYKKQDSIDKWMQEHGPAAIDEKLRSCGLAAETGEIICIGYAVNDQPAKSIYGPEAEILEAFMHEINALITDKKMFPHLVGHNAIDFDIPYIYRRCIVNGVAMPSRFPKPIELKAWSDGITDTMTEWAGIRGKISLDRLAKALGIDGKSGIDGSMVWDMWKAGQVKEICDYCKADVELTRLIYNRLTSPLRPTLQSIASTNPPRPLTGAK